MCLWILYFSLYSPKMINMLFLPNWTTIIHLIPHKNTRKPLWHFHEAWEKIRIMRWVNHPVFLKSMYLFSITISKYSVQFIMRNCSPEVNKFDTSTKSSCTLLIWRLFEFCLYYETENISNVIKQSHMLDSWIISSSPA